jgi:hypothetical protein
MSSTFIIFFSVMMMALIIWHKVFFFTGGWNNLLKNITVFIGVLGVSLAIATNVITNLYSPVILWILGPPIIMSFTALYGFWE